MKNPFIVGSWVRGEYFFGRDKIIREILEGSYNAIWVAGTRRLGKTSLLKQLEYLTEQEASFSQYITLFWDLEGSTDLKGLSNSLLESIEDSEKKFEAIGIDVLELEGRDVFEILRILKRKTKQENLKLLLLCDECEELITVGQNNPEVLPKLRRIFQQSENMMTVITATKRLNKLEKNIILDTSPFLHGFIPPFYLSYLEDQHAERLIRQGNFDDDIVKEIKQKTNNHPYLIQLICKRLFENGDFNVLLNEVCADEMLSHFFEVDFKYLVESEKEIIWNIVQEDTVSLTDLQSKVILPHERIVYLLNSLSQLGYIKQENNDYSISNYFFHRWLIREQDRLFENLISLSGKTSISDKLKTANEKKKFVVGDVMSHYRILEEIGSGGMGIVYKALDVNLDRIVALKIINPEMLENEQAVTRFSMEAKTSSSLNHPNITTIYEFDEEEGIHFLSMEYVPGQTLAEKLKKGPLSLEDVIKYACQIGEGLLNAHHHKVIHRDIKPNNIKISDEGIVKIMDFGIAKIMDQPAITKTGDFVGTVAYMSPEQLGHGVIDHRSDIYAYAVVLYEMTTGRLPFIGDHEVSILYSIINETPIPVTQLNPGIPVALEKVIKKGLEKDKENRHKNMGELLNELKQL